jgi:hypothetical protein
MITAGGFLDLDWVGLILLLDDVCGVRALVREHEGQL